MAYPEISLVVAPLLFLGEIRCAVKLFLSRTETSGGQTVRHRYHTQRWSRQYFVVERGVVPALGNDEPTRYVQVRSGIDSWEASTRACANADLPRAGLGT